MQGAHNAEKNIDYFGIIKKSWQITWENKNLWWFGLLASFGGGINLSVPFNDSNFQEGAGSMQEMQANIVDFFSRYYAWIIVGLVVLLVIVIGFSVLRIFGRIGLVNSIGRAVKGKKTGFKSGLKEGKLFFWQIFSVDILLGVFNLGIAVVLFVPVGYLFYLEALPAAFLSLFLGIIIFIALITLASIMRAYVYIYVILGKISIREAIENAYKVFSQNMYSSVIMLLVLLFVGILAGVAIAGVIIVLVMVSGLLGGILFWLFGKIGIIIAVILGLLAVIPAFLLIRSIQEVFCQAVWIVFFREIAEIKEFEGIKEANQGNIAEKIPDPEAA